MPGPSPPPWKQNVEAMRACALPVAFASTDPVARRLSLALRTEALAPIVRVGNAALLIDRLVIRSIHLEKILFSLDLILKFMALLFIVVFLAMLRKAYMGFLKVIVISDLFKIKQIVVWFTLFFTFFTCSLCVGRVTIVTIILIFIILLKTIIKLIIEQVALFLISDLFKIKQIVVWFTLLLNPIRAHEHARLQQARLIIRDLRTSSH